LNPQPSDYKSGALPVELSQQRQKCYQYRPKKASCAGDPIKHKSPAAIYTDSQLKNQR